MKLSLSPLAWAVNVALVTPVYASSPAQMLDPIRISASPFNVSAQEMVSPATILQGPQLNLNRAPSLGELLGSQPGIHSDTFGSGASRPVIRGQTAPRIKVLSDGSEIMDASNVSPDHAITIDTWLAERVEILRGPASLLFGGSSIGGVVNVIDRKVPTYIPDRPEGALHVEGSSVDQGRASAVELTTGADNIALHIEGSHHKNKDYRVPQWHDSHVNDSRSRSDAMSLGLSFIGDQGYLGGAYSYREDTYGLPGHTHEYESCHPHGSSLHCGGHGHEHEHEHEHEHDEHNATAHLRHQRFDLRGELRDPLPGFEYARLRAAYTDYHHVEKENGQAGTRFSNRGYDTRLELSHQPIGQLKGVVGLQTSLSDFASKDGHENFIPKTRTRNQGLFLLEHIQWDNWRVEFGARHEWQTITPNSQTLRRHKGQANSLSVGTTWKFAPEYSASLSLSRSQRLPNAQELFAKGVHFATLTYEQGNPHLERETSNNIDIGVSKHTGDLRLEARAFYNRNKNYIYARTLDQSEDFRLIRYSQDEAQFWGLEAQASYPLTSAVSLSVYGDLVRGKLLHPDRALPRMPAARLGVRSDLNWQNWAAYVSYTQTLAQHRSAEFERDTASFGMLSMGVSYTHRVAQTDYTVYLKGSNLLNKLAYNHTSFISRHAPFQGRNITAGLRIEF